MKQALFIGENTNAIRADSLSFSTSPTTKNITSLTISFTYLLKKCGRDCQVNTIRLFSFHLISYTVKSGKSLGTERGKKTST